MYEIIKGFANGYLSVLVINEKLDKVNYRIKIEFDRMPGDFREMFRKSFYINDVYLHRNRVFLVLGDWIIINEREKDRDISMYDILINKYRITYKTKYRALIEAKSIFIIIDDLIQQFLFNLPYDQRVKFTLKEEY